MSSLRSLGRVALSARALRPASMALRPAAFSGAFAPRVAFRPQQQQARGFATAKLFLDTTPAQEIVNVLPVREKDCPTMLDHAWTSCLALPTSPEGETPEAVNLQFNLALENAVDYIKQHSADAGSIFRVDIVYKDEADLPELEKAFQIAFPSGKPFKQFVPARPLDFEGNDYKVALNIVANKNYAWIKPAIVFLAVNWFLWAIVISS